MSWYRKRPVVIEARLFDPGQDYDEALAVVKWAGGTATDEGCVIHTLEGDHLARPGDYVIRGVRGEFYPCEGSIFRETYEPAEPLPLSDDDSEAQADAAERLAQFALPGDPE